MTTEKIPEILRSAQDDIRTISARWVAPVATPPIADGIVSFADGRITYVGEADGRKIDERYDDAILLPGFVNAHTHLDLTGAKGKTPPTPVFTEWLKSVIEYRKTRSEEEVQEDILNGVRQSIAAGTTVIGDISVNGQSATLLNEWRQATCHSEPPTCHSERSEESPDGERRIPEILRCAQDDSGGVLSVVFRELIGLAEDRCVSALQLSRSWILHTDKWLKNLRPGLSPHAPYSFGWKGIPSLAGHHIPIACHVAESMEEITLVNYRRGPFVEFLRSLNAWHPDGLPADLTEVVAYMNRLRRPLFIHANYLDPETTFTRTATIVYCPRTHAAFGHPPHPFRHFLKGVRVVLATDSLASNPDLSLLAEARFVVRQHPDLNPALVLQMITSWPAAALMFENECGTLERDKRADFAVVELPDRGEPLHTLFHEDTPIKSVYVAGARVV